LDTNIETERYMSSKQDLEHFDVVIVGAGLSGVDAAYRLKTRRSGKRFCILEARDAIGGTWDLFRFPGIRSDSAMHTLGFPFRPWQDEKVIADGASIRSYIQETAEYYGIDREIRFGSRVVRASWSSAEALWTLDIRSGESSGISQISCVFLYLCSGYYEYARGYMPDFPGVKSFSGRLVHPQFWPQDLDYDGRRVVVIGSGATAVTLVPAMAKTAAHVTMLQRSPSYVVSRPASDSGMGWFRRNAPEWLAKGFLRWMDVIVGSLTYSLARRLPKQAKHAIVSGVRKALGPDYDVETHFSPSYDPWDQRVCLAPDGDLFSAIRAGQVSMVTDTIETFTGTGIRLISGREILADIVVVATGLNMKLAGGMDILVDGVRAELAEKTVYKGMMLSDVPNLALAFGYINASWTLKCDLTARAVCRLLTHMERCGYASCTPRLRDSSVTKKPLLNFTSGYVRRAQAVLPHQGSKGPWRVRQNYLLDLISHRIGPIEDGALEFAAGSCDRRSGPGKGRN